MIEVNLSKFREKLMIFIEGACLKKLKSQSAPNSVGLCSNANLACELKSFTWCVGRNGKELFNVKSLLINEKTKSRIDNKKLALTAIIPTKSPFLFKCLLNNAKITKLKSGNNNNI